MNYSNVEIVLQEVPNEISLCFSICGCPLRCKGCHSPFLWKEKAGLHLSEELFEAYLNKYSGLITCVLFMGGEWHEQTLIRLLKLAKKRGLKTCLYTGQNNVTEQLKSQLSFLKTGPWIKELGGLADLSTNQVFIEVSTNKNLNHLFNSKKYDQINVQTN